MIDLPLIEQMIINGLLIGGIYALVGITLTLIFGVIKIINFAHGSFLTLGMYVTYWMFALFGVNPYASIPISMIVLFVIGVGIEYFLIDRILETSENNQLLLTLGLMLVIDNLAICLWQPIYRTVTLRWLEEPILLGSLIINKARAIAFIFALALTVFLYVLLKRTDPGMAIRATANERKGALLVGINTKMIYAITFGIGLAFVGATGSVIAPFLYIYPTVGSETFLLRSFAIITLGGLGNFWGALAGGFIIGIIEAIGAIFLAGTLYEMLPFVLFICILLFRPEGLFSRRRD